MPEQHSGAAERLLDPSFKLHVPALLFSEIGNVLWKRVVTKDISQDMAAKILLLIESMPLKAYETTSGLQDAFNIACQSRRTFYDSLYIALAKSLNCRAVTADKKLYNALKNGPFDNAILWVEDIP